MAQVVFGQSGTRPYGVLEVNETSYSIANNTSTVSIKLTLKRPYSISGSSSVLKYASVTINGTTHNWSGYITGSGDLTLINTTQTVAHNNDGTKSISISASIGLNITWSGTYVGTISGSGSMSLTNIPRYATVSQSISSVTETTAVMNWSSDSIIDYIWYSTNNGSTWMGIDVADGTSGTYTISGLAANTAYNIKTRVRRRDSQLTTVSGTTAVTTYAYPYATSMPNFQIGNSVTITIYNPLKRNVTVQMLGADGSSIGSLSTTGTTVSGFNSSTSVTNLYKSIPSAASGKYQIKVKYGSQTSTKNGGTYSVNTSVCSPAVTGLTYKDTSSAVVAITGNNQNIVRNQSVVQYNATGISAKQYASIKNCSVTVNGSTYTMSLSGASASGGNAKINSAADVTATVTVTDSRGLTAQKSVTVKMYDWTSPTAIITLNRWNNYYSNTDITVDASFSAVGSNSITIAYKAKIEGTSAYTVSGTLTDGETQTFEADNESAWDVVVTVTDKFATTTYNLKLSRGMPIIFFDRVLSSTGFNCFPAFSHSVEANGYGIIPEVLYDNSSGTTGTVTLEETAANFKFLEIYYMDNNNKDCDMKKVCSPNGKTVSLALIDANSTTSTYIRRVKCAISGTSITQSNGGYVNINGSTVTSTAGSYIKIIKVVGYR